MKNKTDLSESDKVAIKEKILSYDFEDIYKSLSKVQKEQATHLRANSEQVLPKTNIGLFLFTRKLVIKKSWEWSFAITAIDEYKRFIITAMYSYIPTTPPPIIDEVWHMHILFQKEYDKFVKDTLGFNFFHKPGLGIEDHGKIHKEGFQELFHLYVEIFSQLPPREIWGGLTPERESSDENKRNYGGVDDNSNLGGGNRIDLCSDCGSDNSSSLNQNCDACGERCFD